MHNKHLQPENDNETIIAIDGLAEELTLLHITDSHMATAVTPMRSKTPHTSKNFSRRERRTMCQHDNYSKRRSHTVTPSAPTRPY